MPSPVKIFDYWATGKGSHLLKYWGVDFVLSIPMLPVNGKNITTLPSCFACGFPFRVQRCHVRPNRLGGSECVDNLHLLCPSCHLESENLYGKPYFNWLHSTFKNDYRHPVRRLVDHFVKLDVIPPGSDLWDRVVKSREVADSFWSTLDMGNLWTLWEEWDTRREAKARAKEFYQNTCAVEIQGPPSKPQFFYSGCSIVRLMPKGKWLRRSEILDLAQSELGITRRRADKLFWSRSVRYHLMSREPTSVEAINAREEEYCRVSTLR